MFYLKFINFKIVIILRAINNREFLNKMLANRQ